MIKKTPYGNYTPDLVAGQRQAHLLAEIPAGWDVRLFKIKHLIAVVAIHPEHKPRFSIVGPLMAPFEKWEFALQLADLPK